MAGTREGAERAGHSGKASQGLCGLDVAVLPPVPGEEPVLASSGAGRRDEGATAGLRKGPAGGRGCGVFFWFLASALGHSGSPGAGALTSLWPRPAGLKKNLTSPPTKKEKRKRERCLSLHSDPLIPENSRDVEVTMETQESHHFVLLGSRLPPRQTRVQSSKDGAGTGLVRGQFPGSRRLAGMCTH